MAQGAVDFLFFLHEASDGEGIVVVGGFGDLAAEFALAMLELAAAQGSDGAMEKLGGERLVLLHDDGHEESAVVVGEREGHEVGAIGQGAEDGVDERFGAQALVELLGAEGVVGLLGGVVDLLLAVVVGEGEGEFALRRRALGGGCARLR